MPEKNPLRRERLPLFLSAYMPIALWAALIYYLSSQTILPGFYVETYDFIFKKSAHITVYAILYLLFYRAQMMVVTTNRLSKQAWLLPFCFVLLYAASDELHQQFVSGRFGTLRDIGFDILGASLAFLKLYRYI
ncbi:MAG: hypothetical protein A2632_02575 [Candidatus Pacebacteria bacterium RIFCSPHIGHO2_01_FULL_46_16]|nr:MAG: hypothetical protein A2632_02575 [Candidatus Pacebacteria bacterium RIFCSPHIGHO2_01_FULL_46_16]OGJ22146.1 MAG: hypothetical protein A3J60_03230 [Candidatus Pacebacteria bacterium RIFCSPHIGHO2_02_FULL_46_9]OGJ38266.1 MAG: hypothetical protein A3A82_01535 [Candidatus Pacebacteria bacterium RIFCSPLOWO2_01_FULL_47_12]